ncbi:MAG: hypothetical protein K8R60_03895 [Burkholderiales bacterium]|nr:hypothetical protein [Burkholderiales bacterium]
MTSTPAHADSSCPQLASYYERHMALLDGVAYGWVGRGPPMRMRAGARQVGVSKDAFFALLDDGRLITWDEAPDAATNVMPGVATFASGQSAWFAIDRAHALWRGGGTLPAPQRVADEVATACICDGADYYIRRDDTLWVKGLAHRGQYGDGRLTATTDFVNTARDAVAVKAHTGHALYLSKGGVVMGTGGNRFGPLGANGLGDKADRWGRVFDGARTMATCSRHSRSRPSQPATRRRLRSARTAASGNGTVASGRAVCAQRDRPQWGLVGHPGDLGASRPSSNLMPVIGFSLAGDLGTSRRKRCRLQNCQSDQRHRRSRHAVGSDQRSISRCSASTPSSTPRNLSPNGVKRYSTRGGSSG